MSKKLEEDVLMSFPTGVNMVRTFSKVIYRERPNVIYVPTYLTISGSTSIHPRWSDSGNVIIYGTDKFNFNMIPGNNRSNSGVFSNTGNSGYFWLTDTPSEYQGRFVQLRSNLSTINVNSIGSSYGYSIRCVRSSTSQELLLSDGTIIESVGSDYDGNIYSGTKIGTQVWIRENLKTTKYNTGELIPTNLSNFNWSEAPFNIGSEGAMTIYNKSDLAFVPFDEITTEALCKSTFGCLYNWYAAVSVKGIAPSGFNVPTEAEFAILTNYLIASGSFVGYNSPNDVDITSLNIADSLKSYRQINSPFTKTILQD